MRRTVGLTACIAALGCNDGGGDTFEPPVRQEVAFEGNVDPAYVGKWQNANKTSTVDIRADGTATMKVVAFGRGESTSDGQWKLAGENLLFKVGDNVSRYAVKLDGDKLRMSQKATKLDVEYRRTK